MQPLLIDRKTAAAALGVSTRTLDYAVIRGLLKPRRLGRRVMFSPKELERFAARDHSRIAPAAAPGSRDEG